jgi:hypothetical protein
MKNLRMVDEGEISVDVKEVEKGEYTYLYDERTSGKAKIGIQ